MITEDEDYYPWGGELQFVNSDSNHYKFTGKERDSETGLDYLGARYYGNWYGRFLSADWSATPIPVPYSDFQDPQTLNLYSYVRSMPTTKADGDGHGWWEKFKNRMGEAGCWCEGKEAEKAKQERQAKAEEIQAQMRAGMHSQKGQMAMIGILLASDPLALAGVEAAGEVDVNAVRSYEVGTYGELGERSVVGDGLNIDHIPSNASNLARETAAKGEALTPAEATAVRNQGTAVAVPDAAHRSSSPTYGGRNTPGQIQADAANPQAAAARDTRAMVNAASPSNRNAAQAAAKKIQDAAAKK